MSPTFFPNMTLSDLVRRQWSYFEEWLAGARAAMEKRRAELFADADKRWRATPAARRPSKQQHAQEKQELERHLQEELVLHARIEWERRLRDANLNAEDWEDMTPEEQRAVSRALGGLDDDAEDEVDEDGFVFESIMRARGPAPTAASASAPVPAPPPVPSNYMFVSPSTFVDEERYPEEIPFDPVFALSSDASDEEVDVDTLAYRAWGAASAWQQPSLPSVQTSRQSSIDSATAEPKTRHAPVPAPAAPPPPPASERRRSPPAPERLPEAQPEPAHVKARRPTPRYTGPTLNDPTDVTEEEDFQQFKMDIRVTKILEFHRDAAIADIDLARGLVQAQRTGPLAASEEARMIKEHDQRLKELQRAKEDERRAIVDAERQRRKAEIRRRATLHETVTNLNPAQVFQDLLSTRAVQIDPEKEKRFRESQRLAQEREAKVADHGEGSTAQVPALVIETPVDIAEVEPTPAEPIERRSPPEEPRAAPAPVPAPIAPPAPVNNKQPAKNTKLSKRAQKLQQKAEAQQASTPKNQPEVSSSAQRQAAPAPTKSSPVEAPPQTSTPRKAPESQPQDNMSKKIVEVQPPADSSNKAPEVQPQVNSSRKAAEVSPPPPMSRKATAPQLQASTSRKAAEVQSQIAASKKPAEPQPNLAKKPAEPQPSLVKKSPDAPTPMYRQTHQRTQSVESQPQASSSKKTLEASAPPMRPNMPKVPEFWEAPAPSMRPNMPKVPEFWVPPAETDVNAGPYRKPKQDFGSTNQKAPAPIPAPPLAMASASHPSAARVAPPMVREIWLPPGVKEARSAPAPILARKVSDSSLNSGYTQGQGQPSSSAHGIWRPPHLAEPKARLRRMSDPPPPSPSLLDEPSMAEKQSAQAQGILKKANKPGKSGKAVKRVTIEEVSDEEADEGVSGKRSGKKKAGRDHPTDANTILEPKPSVPPAMFTQIFQYGEEAASPVLVAPALSASTSASTQSGASLDDWFGGEGADDAKAANFEWEVLLGPNDGKAAKAKHVRWTPSVLANHMSPEFEAVSLPSVNLSNDSRSAASRKTMSSRSRSNSLAHTLEGLDASESGRRDGQAVDRKGKGKAVRQEGIDDLNWFAMEAIESLKQMRSKPASAV